MKPSCYPNNKMKLRNYKRIKPHTNSLHKHTCKNLLYTISILNPAI